MLIELCSDMDFLLLLLIFTKACMKIQATFLPIQPYGRNALFLFLGQLYWSHLFWSFHAKYLLSIYWIIFQIHIQNLLGIFLFLGLNSENLPCFAYWLNSLFQLCSYICEGKFYFILN
jgi:hypothetical protein